MHESIELSIDGFEVALKRWGEGQDTPIIALHGWLDNANSFDRLGPLIQKSPVYALDLPGHGLTQALSNHSHYHFIDGVPFVLSVAKALGFKKYHLLGHSMGACLASLIAACQPKEVDTLFLIEGLGPLSQNPQDSFKNYVKYLTAYDKQKIKQHPGYASIQEAILTRAANGYISIELATSLCERALIKRENRYYWRHDKRLTLPSAMRMTEQQVCSFLTAIAAPTHLFTAQDGFDFSESIMRNRIQCVKNLQHHALDGGHHLHMENPSPIASIINQTLQQNLE